MLRQGIVLTYDVSGQVWATLLFAGNDVIVYCFRGLA